MLYEGIQKLCFSYGRVGHLKAVCLYTVRKGNGRADMAESILERSEGSYVGHKVSRTGPCSTMTINITSRESGMVKASRQYRP